MAETVSLPYLEALKGKFVKVFKGGPDSREGKLLEVKDDYIVLQTEDNQFVYYASQYLKIVIGKAKKSDVGVFPVDEARVFPNTFLEVLETLVASTIKVNGGGPESKIGQVLDAKEEFLVLSTEKDGLVVFPYSNVKNVTILESQSNDDLSEVTFSGAITLNDVLTMLIHNWVSINTGGPEKVGGVLVEVADEHVIVVQNEEIFYVTTEQIKVMSLAKTSDEDENSSNTGSSENSNSNKGSTEDSNSNKGSSENSNSNKGSSENNNSTESSSYESGTAESSSYESDTTESSSYESDTTESSSYESDTTESSSYESDTTESSSYESGTAESSSEESGTAESSSYESSTAESSSEESGTTESSSYESDSTESSSEEVNTTESSSEEVNTTESSSEEVNTTESSSEEVNTTESSSEEVNTT
ncbi:hypothetical protein, partial [Peribacillus butanolivorans]|uniref:hypothetical protein n=1 Tax=Peribacillus butanolivorans TaxID=421767 RepID=UPI0038121ABD